MKKCIYCAQETDAPLTAHRGTSQAGMDYPCCSAECREKAEQYFRRTQWGRLFFYLLTAVSVLLILSTTLGFAQNRLVPAMGGALFGLAVASFSLPPADTLERMGIRSATRTSQGMGMVLMVLLPLLLWFL